MDFLRFPKSLRLRKPLGQKLYPPVAACLSTLTHSQKLKQSFSAAALAISYSTQVSKMKQVIIVITALILLASCREKTKRQKVEMADLTQEEVVQTEESPTDSIDKITKYDEYESQSNEIAPDGKYRFDIAFAEWQGKSMGEKVTVIINGHSIKVIYEGDGKLTLTKKGEILDQGEIIKHKSGDWIISSNPSDKDLEEVGACTGGPAIIDFKNRKYWMC